MLGSSPAAVTVVIALNLGRLNDYGDRGDCKSLASGSSGFDSLIAHYEEEQMKFLPQPTSCRLVSGVKVKHTSICHGASTGTGPDLKSGISERVWGFESLSWRYTRS